MVSYARRDTLSALEAVSVPSGSRVTVLSGRPIATLLSTEDSLALVINEIAKLPKWSSQSALLAYAYS